MPSYLEKFIQLAQQHKCIIGLGLAEDIEQNRRMIQCAVTAISKTPSQIVFIGSPEIILQMKELTAQTFDRINFYGSAHPSDFMVHQALDPFPFKTSSGLDLPGLDGVIRGGLSSSGFLKALRSFNAKTVKNPVSEDFPALTYRLALLETAFGEQFFYAPVGIDECNTFPNKRQLVSHAIQFLQQLLIKPKIGLLSGGRKSDLGRDPWIDENIEQIENLTDSLQREYKDLQITHYDILIESAIKDHVNFLLAPEGIAGNLIYRTLVHLGNGKAYGALYLTHFNILKKIIIDTSRVAQEFEIEGAIFFAIALHKMLQNR
jgi:predicted methyltransferase MtxX (methanogen marker protein 4)